MNVRRKMAVTDQERALVELVREGKPFVATLMITPDGEFIVDTASHPVTDVSNHRVGIGLNFSEAWAARRQQTGYLR